MRVPILALASLLAACHTTTALRTECLPLKPYTAAEQAQMASEIMALPPGDILVRAMIDYGAMREADRACLASGR